jgi:hypothetical protein
MPGSAERRREARFRCKAQERLPTEVRQQLLDAIYSGQPFRSALRDIGLTPNQVWGLTKTDEEWSGWRGGLGPKGFRGFS